MKMNDEAILSRALAPEDIAAGDFVYVLQVMCEYLPLSCLIDPEWRPVEPVRVTLLPSDEPAPMKVIEVCAPFVLVRQACGKHKTLDLRQCRLARVSPRFGKKAFKRLTRPAPRCPGNTVDG